MPLQQFIKLLLTWVEGWARSYDAGTAYQGVKMKKEVRQHRSGDFYMIPGGESLTLEHWVETFEYDTFDEFRVNLFKGWITKVIDNPDEWLNGTCNCPIFLKSYMCKHVLGIAICLKLFQPRFEAKQIPLGQKRKRGRPKLAKKALIRQYIRYFLQLMYPVSEHLQVLIAEFFLIHLITF